MKDTVISLYAFMKSVKLHNDCTFFQYGHPNYCSKCTVPLTDTLHSEYGRLCSGCPCTVHTYTYEKQCT